MDFISLVILLVIILDPVGLVPVVQGMLKDFTPRQRTRILLREQLFALAILLVFYLFGNTLMTFLGLEQATLNISGGVLLFMVALGMVFPSLSLTSPVRREGKAEAPFIVPIAVPLIAGPSVIAIILLHSAQATDMADKLMLGGAVVSSWAISSVIILLSQYVMKFLGDRGASALEKLMGMLLILISVQMFINGLKSYSDL